MPIAISEAPRAKDLAATLRNAIQLHQSGRLQEALPLYREALELDPDNPDALHLCGILAHQIGRHVEALELVDRALARLPGFADAHNTRGNLLRALGRPDDALGAFRQAMALAPGSAMAWSNLGNALRDLGRPEEALRAYREAIARDPGLAETHLNRGIVLRELGEEPETLAAFTSAVALRPDLGAAHAALGSSLRRAGRLEESIESFRRALSLDPDLTGAYCELGAALCESGQYGEATDALQAALALEPNRPEAHNWMGNVCKALGYLDQALSAYRQALADRPDYAEAHYNLGLLLVELHRPVEAIASFRAALTFRSDYAEAHAEMGVTLLRVGRADEAVTALRRSLDLEPVSASAWYHLGRALQDERRSREAAAAYARAIAISPEFAEAHWHRALALLAAGEYEAGWREYQWRRKLPELAPPERAFEAPLWDGSPLEGRTILIRAEEGPGNTLQFARFLSMVSARGGRVVLECAPALTRLLEAMPDLAQVVARGDALPPFDCHVALEDLPRLLGVRLATVPDEVPYLPAQTWSGRIPMLPEGSGLKVGLVWGGAARSQPGLSLAALVPLFTVPGVTWYSLQGGNEPSTWMIDLGPSIKDLTDTAAFIGQLDLVIAIDGVEAHLAGGLGAPLWVLLGSAPDWRWSTEAGECAWYPTAKLFRQPRTGDWASVIEEIRRTLVALRVAEDARV